MTMILPVGGQKLALIDRLIDSHHLTLRSRPCLQGTADNLVKGSRQEMVHLLDQISAGLAGADGGRSQTDEDLDAAAPRSSIGEPDG